MSLTWVRSHFRSQFYNEGWILLGQIPNGQKYVRIRWSWGFAGFTNVTTDLAATARNIQTAGLVTTIGTGAETPPHPIDTPNDVAPPTQRWLWWEQRQPVALSVDSGSDTVSWRDSAVQEVPDVQTQVLATAIPGGQFLNLWFSWQSYDGNWDASGQQQIWVAASVLINVP